MQIFFIKVFEEFVSNAESEIPTRSKEDIIQHNAWYKEYIILRENKRTAIAEWKNMKEVQAFLKNTANIQLS